MSQVEIFLTPELLSQPAAMIRAGLLGVDARSLMDESRRNDERARWLKVGYVLVALGLLLTAAAGTIATIDAYSNGRAPTEQEGA